MSDLSIDVKKKPRKVVIIERKAIAEQLIEVSGLASGEWVALDRICDVRDFVLKQHGAFSDVFPKTFLPTKEALVGETYRRVVVNMMRRCAKLTNAAILAKKIQKWKDGGNKTSYMYKLLT